MIALKLDEFVDTKSLDKLTKLYQLITEEKLSAKETGIKYRVLNHWDEKGIIRFSRTSSIGNRKFSFVDFVWIKIVNELRSFGIGINTIKQIASDVYHPLPFKEMIDQYAQNIELLKDYKGERKEEFDEFVKSGEYKTVDWESLGLRFNFLQLFITEAIATRNSVSIIVFKNGEWFPFIKENEHLYSKDLLHKKEFHSQVRINITDLIFTFITEDYLKNYLENKKLPI
jgi:DNA-binding transcriptional MerR regulator